jgi:hypothetical protein
MTSSIVLRRVVNSLGGGRSVRALRERLKAQPSADMAGISIVATEPDSRLAASLANAVATAYQKVAAERASQAASHRVSLGHLRDVRERLAFAKTPPIGHIYLRPRGLGVRTLWERLQRSARRGAGTPTVGPKREQRA